MRPSAWQPIRPMLVRMRSCSISSRVIAPSISRTSANVPKQGSYRARKARARRIDSVHAVRENAAFALDEPPERGPPKRTPPRTEPRKNAASRGGPMWIRQLRDVGLSDVSSVGGKNASLGELLRALVPLGVNVPDGFAVTADGYRHFIDANGLAAPIGEALRGIRKGDVTDLVRRSDGIRELMTRAPLPADLESEIAQAYDALARAGGGASLDVAVRSSATAEDLPNASFAGQQETFLDVRGAAAVTDAVRKTFASLFTPRAINYREDMKFEHMRVALSVGVQRMVRSDLASAGVIFTLDTDTGHRGVVLVTSSFGLGESVVQGRVIPDQFVVHKDRLNAGFRPLVRRKLGAKESGLVYDEGGHRAVRTERVPEEERARFSLADDDVITLAKWALRIEEHYSRVRGED